MKVDSNISNGKNSFDIDRVKLNVFKAKNIINDVVTTIATVGGFASTVVGNCTSNENVKKICSAFDANTLASIADNSRKLTDSVFAVATGNEVDSTSVQTDALNLRDGLKKVINAVPKYKSEEKVIIDGDYREINDDTLSR